MNNMYCSDAPCLPSRTAMYTGRFGIHTGVVSHGGTAEVVTPVVEKWIKANAASKEDWYLHINYWDPHTPYRTPEDYPNHFANDPLPDWITDEVFEQHKQKVGPHGAREVGMFSWERPKRFPKHPGENMGELGIYGEHATADQATTHIPMIIRWPGKVTPGSTDDGLHYNLDMAPTLAAMFGKDSFDNWDGQSYASTITEGKDTGRGWAVPELMKRHPHEFE